MIDEKLLHYLKFDPPMLDDINGRIVAENDEFIVFYTPGRTVYIDSVQGSQYQPSEYIILKRDEDIGGYEEIVAHVVEEVLRFTR